MANVETGEKAQLTDGLADAMYPVWDASGKYLWFLASTDFGLASQWLDMTSYGREETFALYLAVLNKSEASPLLPESDEDPGVGARPAENTNKPAAAFSEIDCSFPSTFTVNWPAAGCASRNSSFVPGTKPSS